MFALNQVSRGRSIKSGAEFPEKFKPLVNKFVSRAQTIDKTMPGMDPNTVLINYYQEGATFKWHRVSQALSPPYLTGFRGSRISKNKTRASHCFL